MWLHTYSMWEFNHLMCLLFYINQTKLILNYCTSFYCHFPATTENSVLILISMATYRKKCLLFFLNVPVQESAFVYLFTSAQMFLLRQRHSYPPPPTGVWQTASERGGSVQLNGPISTESQWITLLPVDGLLLFATIHIEPNDVVLHLGPTTQHPISDACHVSTSVCA